MSGCENQLNPFAAEHNCRYIITCYGVELIGWKRSWQALNLCCHGAGYNLIWTASELLSFCRYLCVCVAIFFI